MSITANMFSESTCAMKKNCITIPILSKCLSEKTAVNISDPLMKIQYEVRMELKISFVFYVDDI